nr:protein-methionine-sulfoxide reductase heme-binding subunit MsrQ [Paramagnetospirillum kuznetsovii]
MPGATALERGRPGRMALKPLVFALCLLPLVWLGWKAFDGFLGANPIEAVVRYLGDWALRFLLIALAVTPLRQITGWSWLARLRRMLGLFAFAYVIIHLMSYIGLDQFFDWSAIGREIVKRKYITIGMAAVLLLVPLAVTSTDAMVRRLGGKRWRRLHKLVYVIAPLGVAHHWMMVKKDLTEPMIHAVILAVLLGWRIVAARRAARHNGGGPSRSETACAVRSSS